jgi:hypothetical protein
LLGTADDPLVLLAAPLYDSAGRAVHLAVAPGQKSLKLSRALQLTLDGTRSILDEAGNRLDGDEDGSPGGDFVAIAGPKFSYRDRDGDTVSLALAKGGSLVLSRHPDGEGKSLVVLPPVTTTTVLSGKVKRPKSGLTDGITTLQSISGLGVALNKLPLCGVGPQPLTSGCFQTPPAAISAAVVDSLLQSGQFPREDELDRLMRRYLDVP